MLLDLLPNGCTIIASNCHAYPPGYIRVASYRRRASSARSFGRLDSGHLVELCRAPIGAGPQSPLKGSSRTSLSRPASSKNGTHCKTASPPTSGDSHGNSTLSLCSKPIPTTKKLFPVLPLRQRRRVRRCANV